MKRKLKFKWEPSHNNLRYNARVGPLHVSVKRTKGLWHIDEVFGVRVWVTRPTRFSRAEDAMVEAEAFVNLYAKKLFSFLVQR